MSLRRVCIGALIMTGLIVVALVWRSQANDGPAAAPLDASQPVLVQPTVSGPDTPTVSGPETAPPLPPAPITSSPASEPTPTAQTAPGTAAPRPDPPAPKRRQPGGERPPESRTVPPPGVPAPPAAASVSGTYRVVDTFPEGFIGEVMVRNGSGQAVRWQVSLQLPDTVTELRTSWVDGTPPPEVRRTGQTVVFTGSQAAPSGASVPLRFLFTRTGSRTTPLTCTVNDVRCGGAV